MDNVFRDEIFSEFPQMTELIPLIDFLIKEVQRTLDLQTIGKFAIIFTFLFLLPITLSILHYLRTKLTDYLLLVGFLACWIANSFSSLLHTPGVIINELEVAFIALSVLIVSSSSTWSPLRM